MKNSEHKNNPSGTVKEILVSQRVSGVNIASMNCPIFNPLSPMFVIANL